MAPGMDPAGIPALLESIRHMHGCSARHVETAHVRETAPTGETVWDGDVEVFELVGHDGASRAYAWSEAVGSSGRRRFFVVLHVPPVDSPVVAVRVSILADAKQAR